MTPDDLVKGGQGRSAQDVRDTTAGCLIVVVIAVFIGMAALVVTALLEKGG